MIHLAEGIKTMGLLKPAADAAGRTSRYLSLKEMHDAWIVCYIDQGNAATIALTPKQATNVAGAGAKNLLQPVQVWLVNDFATSDAWVRQADGTSFTTDATVKEKMVLFRIAASGLDINNLFCTVAIATGASNAANITSAVAHMTQRYHPSKSVLLD